jgi:membrane protein required for beta-lactamase induction
MKFLALLLALGFERLWSSQRQVRDPGWRLAYVRGSLRWAARQRDATRVAAVIAAAAAPGLLVAVVLGGFHDSVSGLVWIALAGLVLFFALGPRDLQQEVYEWLSAVQLGDAAAAQRLRAEILEYDAAQRRGPALASVAEAVFVQANNRLFGVVFWFVLLGPFGALLFRLGDLLRREALLRAARADAPPGAGALAADCQRVHGVLAWAPSRLLALTYGVAGSFEESFAGWRAYLRDESDHFFDANDRLLVLAGRGALGARWSDAPDEAERTRRAMRLVRIAFYAWLAAVGALTLVAWIA